MTVKTAQTLTPMFTTAHPTTGAATDADSLPTGTLYVDGTADAASVTVTNITTGIYKAAVTLPALSAGQVVSLIVTATVATVVGAGVVFQDTADTERVSDLNDITIAQIIAGIADGPYDLQEMMRIVFAVAAGKTLGGGTTVSRFRDAADTKNRVSATMDANGNRTAVTLDGS